MTHKLKGRFNLCFNPGQDFLQFNLLQSLKTMRHKLEVVFMTPEHIQRAKELRSQGISLRKIAGELGVSHETVRQYLKVHEGAPEAGVARQTTSVKQVAKLSHSFDTGQIMGEQTPKVGEAQPAEEKKPYLPGERGAAGALAISHEAVPRSRYRKRNDNCKIIIQNG
jgi:lambda repressor-like predicted transcriptional regulator